MSAGVLLYSSHYITDEELAQVIRQTDGLLTPGSPAGYFGGLVAGEAYVWIFRIPCYDGVFDWEGKPLDEDDIVLLDEAKRLLGGEFQTWLYIALNSTPTLTKSGSQQLAVRPAASAGLVWLMTIIGNCFHAKRLSACIKKVVALQVTGYRTFNTSLYPMKRL